MTNEKVVSVDWGLQGKVSSCCHIVVSNYLNL